MIFNNFREEKSTEYRNCLQTADSYPSGIINLKKTEKYKHIESLFLDCVGTLSQYIVMSCRVRDILSFGNRFHKAFLRFLYQTRTVPVPPTGTGDAPGGSAHANHNEPDNIKDKQQVYFLAENQN